MPELGAKFAARSSVFRQPSWEVVVYPGSTEIVRRLARAERHASDAVEQRSYGVTRGEFVFGKYQATVSDDALARGWQV